MAPVKVPEIEAVPRLMENVPVKLPVWVGAKTIPKTNVWLGLIVAGSRVELTSRNAVPVTESPLTVPAPNPLLAIITVAGVVALISTEGKAMLVPAPSAWAFPSAKV